MISVVGGVYHEICMCPNWHETYGSGGRAASAIATIGGAVKLYAYADELAQEVINARAAIEGFTSCLTMINQSIRFSYHHSLATPVIENPEVIQNPLRVDADNVIRFGFLEGDAVIHADYAVYDPQNPKAPSTFHANGSTAKHLALVLNKHEASLFCGKPEASVKELGQTLIAQHKAEVVIIKMGPLGALVCDSSGEKLIPAFETASVWKIGSGDTFVGIFGHYWMDKGLSPAEAALIASKATAYYCQTMGFASEKRLAKFNPCPIEPSQNYLSGRLPYIYLAGPFFTLAQLWMIDEAKKNLKEMGFKVFSPYHDVGKGSAADVVHQDISAIVECDMMLAIGDGLDSGTMYEIGYARAKDKPVVMYSENETSDNRKMMEGTECILCSDYVTSIYQCLWTAVRL